MTNSAFKINTTDYKADVKERKLFWFDVILKFYGNSTIFNFYFNLSSVINIALLKSILSLQKYNDTSFQV